MARKSSIKSEGRSGCFNDIESGQGGGSLSGGCWGYASDIISSSLDMIIAVDKGRRIVEFNSAAQKTFGYSADEVLGKPVDILYCSLDESARVHEAVCRTGRFEGEITNRRKDGDTFRTFISASVLHDGQGDIAGYMGISRDITDVKTAQETLRKSERFLTMIFESIKDPFSIINREYRIVRANDAYAEMRNKRVGDILDKRCYEVLYGRSGVCSGCVVKKTFRSALSSSKDKKIVLSDGTEVWVEIYTHPILDEDREVSHVIEYTRNITGRKKSEEEKRRLIKKLEYLSRTDVLTGLLNRRALIERLGYEVERAKRYGSDLSLLICDVDYFKKINDSHGHAAGDRSLRIIAGILKESLRRIDAVGRYGGDEFMLILPETSLKGAEEFAERVRLLLAEKSFRMQGGKPIRVTLSFGISGFDGGGKADVNALIKKADNALYHSKRSGRDRVCVV